MKVTLFMAQTPNGIIARENGEEDFLSTKNWEEFVELAEAVGCFVVGRKTYESVMEWENHDYSEVDAQTFVVSKKHNLEDKNVTIAESPIELIAEAESQGFGAIILTGGGSLNSSFLEQGLVDELIIDVEPHLLGKGISIFEKTVSISILSSRSQLSLKKE